MSTTTPEPAPTALVPVAKPLFTVAERQALPGFLSGYSGLTRDAYTLDLRQYTAWCTGRGLHLFAAKRVDIESFRGEMEAAGRARATIAPRCTITGFYRYAVEEELLDHSPAAHVRRPRLDYESHAIALDRKRARRVAGRRRPQHGVGACAHLAACPERVADQRRARYGHHGDGSERGHRALTVLRKGGKIVTIPLAPRTARSLDLAIGDRVDGPIFRRADGHRLDRHGASRIVHRIAKRAGVAKPISPHTLRHAFIAAALDAGVPLQDVQEAASHTDPRTTMRYDRARASLDQHATYIVAAYLAGAAR